MRLVEFMAVAPAQLEAFAASTRREAEVRPAEFDRDRDECDWWREVSAYAAYVELQEVIAKERE